MFETLLIFAVGIVPPLLSLFVMKKAEEKARSRLRSAQDIPVVRVAPSPALPADRHYVEGVGEVTGDVTCYYNARSAYLRCAIAPEGPCEGCLHYEASDYFTLK